MVIIRRHWSFITLLPQQWNLRKSHLPSVHTLVVKLGTQLLCGNDGALDANYLSAIAQQVAGLRQQVVAGDDGELQRQRRRRAS